MSRIGFHLCLVTDRHATKGRFLADVVEEAGRAGGALLAVQLREKDLPLLDLLSLAKRLRAVTLKHGNPFFINGRVDVAAAVSADGVHLPSDGLPAAAAKRAADRLGRPLLIGVSCHSPEEASEQAREADFVFLGPIYDTPSKRRYGPPLSPEAISRAISFSSLRTETRSALFAIGGIGPEETDRVTAVGADGVAVSSRILSAEDPGAATRELLRAAARRHPTAN